MEWMLIFFTASSYGGVWLHTDRLVNQAECEMVAKATMDVRRATGADGGMSWRCVEVAKRGN